MIPRIIHQSWRTTEVPERYRDWQASWLRLNPGYEYRLWTNRDIEHLVARDFPQWAALFDGYRENISRIDLARYLILQKFGGIYADLDYECLRPHDRLLQDGPLLFGAEPASHARLGKAVRAGIDPIVCNAWIASAPAHPFWDHLLNFLVTTAAAPDVLDATGPFALTRAIRSYAGTDVTVLRPELLYPVDKEPCWDGRIDDLEFFEQATREAFGIHYWEGSWFRQGTAGRDLRVAKIAARRVRAQRPAGPEAEPQASAPTPLVSCLTITHGEPDAIRRAIRSFRRQTWEHTELLIVTAAPAATLALLRTEYADARLRWVFVAPSEDSTPSGLRDIALNAARGDYVAIWNDDDLHDPSRLQLQMMSLLKTGAQACLLERCVSWWPARQRLSLSARRVQNASLVCLKPALPPADDAAPKPSLANRLLAGRDTIVIDIARLLVDVLTDMDPPPDVTADFSGERYEPMLRELSKRIDIDDWPLARSANGIAAAPRRAGASQAAPKVLVLTPMKNTVRHLERYFGLLQALDYPAGHLSLGIMEGDSTDGTQAALLAYQSRLAGHFARFDLHQHHTGFQITGPRWQKPVQRQRRSVIAEARNRLLSAMLRDEEWVLWLDADLVDYPPALLHELLGAQRDIVAPVCLRPDGRMFDTNTFCFRPDRTAAEREDFLFDGIYQPPPGAGRAYLDEFADQRLVAVDSVGGTALLVRADLHRRGLVFPTYSHRGYIETEGLAAMARDMGVTCWGMPQLRIVHDHP